MKALEKSDEAIVPMKRSNSRVTPEETVEGGAKAKGNAAHETALRTQGRVDVLSVVERISQKAKKKTGERFNNLVSHLKPALLKEAFASLNKKAAPGIDRTTWQVYAEGVDARLQSLADRVHRGTYRPLPVRRVDIPKGDGKTRPLGIPALEDKIVQQAVRWLMEAIYEEEFTNFSHGYRPKRSARGAIDALYLGLTTRRIGYILDADISAFFDSVDHARLLGFLSEKIADSRLLLLVEGWLKAGVMTAEGYDETVVGTPQGGIISPLLSNVYLHCVFDLFVQRWRKEKARSDVIVVRYADDFVIGCSRKSDITSLHAALVSRFEAHGLKLHPTKTRVIEFGAIQRRGRRQETFDFLGFTHIRTNTSWGRRRAGILRVTARKKQMAKLKALRLELHRRRHEPMKQQHRWLCSVVAGHARYYGLPRNRRVACFRHEVEQAWACSLQRRSQRASWGASEWRSFRRWYPLPRRTLASS